MLPALLLAWLVVSIAAAVLLARLARLSRGGEVVIDCDGARTTLSLDELLEAPARGAPAYLSFSQNSAGMSCAILSAPFAPP